MNTWISNDSTGKYLYVELLSGEQTFEYNMISTLTADNLLTPAVTFRDGKACLEYEISGLDSLTDYLSAHSLEFSDLTGLLIQLKTAVETVNRYLLSESSLLTELAAMFYDRNRAALKLCIVPGLNGSFESGIKALLTELVIHINTEDSAALQLGIRLLKAAARPDYRLHDLLAAIQDAKPGAYRPDMRGGLADPTVETTNPATGQADPTAGLTYSADRQAYRTATQSYARPSDRSVPSVRSAPLAADNPDPADQPIRPADHFDPYDDAFAYDDPEAADETPNIRKSLKSLAISQCILGAAVAIVYLLKGAALIRRMLPLYLILAVGLVLYHAVDYIIKTRRLPDTAK